MMYRDIAKLYNIVKTKNATTGRITEATTTKKDVFVNRKSIKQSEFYQAQASKLRPEIAFEIRLVDYSSEKYIEYDNASYQIIRTHSKNFEIIELICQRIEVS